VALIQLYFVLGEVHVLQRWLRFEPRDVIGQRRRVAGFASYSHHTGRSIRLHRQQADFVIGRVFNIAEEAVPRHGFFAHHLVREHDARAQPVEIDLALAAGPAGTAAMIAMLERQQNGRRIGRYVPETPGVRWGSKTGGLKGVTNDVGFVTGPGGRLILAVFCEGMADLHVGERCIGDIARAAMRATGVATPLDPATPRAAASRGAAAG